MIFLHEAACTTTPRILSASDQNFFQSWHQSCQRTNRCALALRRSGRFGSFGRGFVLIAGVIHLSFSLPPTPPSPEGLGIKIMWNLLCVDPLQMRPQQPRCPVNDACVWWYKSSRQQRFEIADHHSSKWSFHYYSCLRRFCSTMAWKPNQVMSANSTLQVWRSRTVSPPFHHV